MDIIQKITEELNVMKWQVEAAVRLIDEGNTIPLLQDTEKKRPERWMMSSSESFPNGLFICGIWRRKRSRFSVASRSREN